MVSFQLSLACDEVAKEKHIHVPSFGSFRSLCFITKRMRRHLLSPVSAECGLIKEKMILFYNLFH